MKWKFEILKLLYVKLKELFDFVRNKFIFFNFFISKYKYLK